MTPSRFGADDSPNALAGKKNARGGNKQGGVDTAKEQGERRRGGDAKRYPESAAEQVPAGDDGEAPAQAKSPPPSKQPPLVKHAEEVRESASSGFDSWTVTLPTRMLTRNEDAASLIRRRNPLGLMARGKEVMLFSMIPAPPAQV